ncbi:MAG: polyprenyl diphosphate synthase [Halobacteriaceae archaeon]
MSVRRWVGDRVEAVYAALLRREVDGAPTHVAVIQDGNRRYARERGEDAAAGHAAGAETTADLLSWCADLGVEELTLYAFSTENFNRPADEREHLFDLIEEKLTEFADADRVHEDEVAINAIGEIDRLPRRVQEAVSYAEDRTAAYDALQLNIALAYGGRAELLGAARDVARDVADGELTAGEVDAATVARRLSAGPARDVDLIVRTGGDERTSNFLPWHANGNEAAVYFCTPYWPAFSESDFLRAIRTYEAREESRRQARVQRALALLRAGVGAELTEARAVVDRVRGSLPASEDPDTGAVDRGVDAD